MVNPFGGIYSGKQVLVTGHTGFKGGWLSLWLADLGAVVSGYSLPPVEGASFFSLLEESTFHHSTLADICDAAKLKESIAAAAPDIIFHLAAQPFVGASYHDPLQTLRTNAFGTAMLLEAVRELESPTAIVVVTSDKCYRNHSPGQRFREGDALGGHDVYSMSKAAAELVVASWHSSFFRGNENLGPLATARGGNALGGGDYGEGRLLPDAVRAFVAQSPLVLRRPDAVRPWQHVLDLIAGYLTLGQQLLSQREKSRLLNYNFGPDARSEKSVQQLVDAWLAHWPGKLSVDSVAQPTYAEAQYLSLDPSHAMNELGWRPAWDFAAAVQQSARWYWRRHGMRDPNAAMLEVSRAQIQEYSQAAHIRGAAWAIA